jgi:hypothetical protein
MDAEDLHVHKRMQGAVREVIPNSRPKHLDLPRVSDAILMASTPFSRFCCAHVPISFSSLPGGHMFRGK